MSYKSFDNEVNTIINIPEYTASGTDKTTHTTTDINNTCFVCLDAKPINKDSVTLLNDMVLFIKECDCKCYSHTTCIKKWIEIKSVCPICNHIILYPIICVDNKDAVVDNSHDIIEIAGFPIWCIRITFLTMYGMVILFILSAYY